MKWLARPSVMAVMLITIPTAACQVAHNWSGDPNHAAKAREESTVRTEAFNSVLPQNVDHSLERQVQLAQSDTIRSDENVRSGGSGVGGGSAPPPQPGK